MDLKEQILEGTLQVFNKKGLKFTLDDVAKKIKISKKTIYTVFNSKEELSLAMVDYCFDAIKESEKKIIADSKMDIVEKIRSVLGVMPESYRGIEFRNLYSLKDKYPEVYVKVEQRLENGWETTISLLEEGIKQKKIRKINIPLFKMMMEASLEQFFQRDILVSNEISYHTALNEVVTILVEGIVI